MWEILFRYKGEEGKPWNEVSDTPDILGCTGVLLNKEQAVNLCLKALKLVSREVIEIRLNEVGSTEYIYIGQNLQ